MEKPLIYIDQNIIGYHLDGDINLAKLSDLDWTYSNEHFDEIRRSNNSQLYLRVLDKIEAKLLELNLDAEWRITGSAKIIEHGTPSQHYEEYLESIDDIDFDEKLFDPLQVWFNGGGDEGLLKDVPSQFAEQVLSLVRDLPVDIDEITDSIKSSVPEFESVIGKMIEQGNDIKKTREAFGDGKGAIGSIKSVNQIKQIWELIGPKCEGISCDQFFGFAPIGEQEHESLPTYLGIVGCCAAMDIIGFQAEKKCRKLDKLPNIRSDSGHIGMGSFCSAIITSDRRLAKRANAIFEYKGIGTSVLLLKNMTRNK